MLMVTGDESLLFIRVMKSEAKSFLSSRKSGRLPLRDLYLLGTHSFRLSAYNSCLCSFLGKVIHWEGVFVFKKANDLDPNH